MPVRQPRRSILRALTAGVAGLSLSGTALGSSATGAGGGTASAGAGIEYTDVQENVTVENYEDYPGYTPTDRERRVRTSVVRHTGPQPIDGVPDEVRYTVVVSTTVASVWIDDGGEVAERAHNVRKIENEIDYPGDVTRTRFPNDEDWIGGHRFDPDGEGPIDRITDDSTPIGAVFDLGWDVVTGAVPYLDEALTVLDFVTDVASIYEDESEETVEFDFPGADPESVVTTYRKFGVQMNRTDEARIRVDTSVDFDMRDRVDTEFSHVLTLDPDTFFPDVDGHPFAEEIRTLVDEGVISGYPDGTFRPERSLTRAEFATMIDEAFDPTPADRPTFSDVEGHWAEEKIRRVAGAGFFGGYPDGTFRPDRSVATVEAIVALSNGLGYSGGDFATVRAAYRDDDAVPDWARQAVADAHEVWNGIGNWPDDAYLRPETDATRAEAAKYVYDSTH